MFPDHDPGLGIAVAPGVGEDLQQMPPEVHSIVIGHRALVGEAADVLETLVRGQRAIGGVRGRGGVSEARIVTREEAGQDSIRLVQGARASAAEFADQAILERAPEALDAAFGLRGGGRNPADTEVLQGAPKLGGGLAETAELLGECEGLPGIALEDAVAIAVDRDGPAVRADEGVEDPEVAIGVFFRAEEGGGHCVGRVVDGAVEDEARATPFEPRVLTGIELEEQALLGHPLASPPIPARSPRARAGQARSHEPAVDGPVGHRQATLLDEDFGEVLVVEAGIGGPGQAEDPLPEGIGQAVVGWSAPIAVRQGSGAVAAEGGQHAACVAHGKTQQLGRLRHGQLAFPHFTQDLYPALLLLRQDDRPLGHTARVTESLLIQGVTESLLTDTSK